MRAQLFFTFTVFLFISIIKIQAQQQFDTLGQPSIAFHGQIQYDFEFLKMNQTPTQEASRINGQEFRRLVLLAKGKIQNNINYKVQFEFAGSKIAYRDVYIRFSDLPFLEGNLTLGSFGEPTGLDKLTTGKNITFLERSMLSCTQDSRWNSGFMYDHFGLFDGLLGLQLSYGFNGLNQTGFNNKHIDGNYHLVGRITSPIYKKKHRLVHIGMNVEMRKRSKTAEDYTLHFRPENHLGAKIPVEFAQLDQQKDIGFELATVLGSFSMQAEYEQAIYHTTEMTIPLHGYYGFISYFLTGEQRAYKKGVFTQNKPLKNLSAKERTIGAIELLARYSVFDYSAGTTLSKGNIYRNFTIGFNWYFNAHTRVMYNYVWTKPDETTEDQSINAHTFRAQVDF